MGTLCLPSYQLHKNNFIAFIWYCGLQSWRLRSCNQAFRGNIWHNSKSFLVPVVLHPRRRWERGKVQAATWSSYVTLKSGYKEKTLNWPEFLLGLHLPQRKLRHTRANLRLVFKGWMETNTAISANSFWIKKTQTTTKPKPTPPTNQHPTTRKKTKKNPQRTNWQKIQTLCFML